MKKTSSTCCLSFLFVSCESEFDGGGTGGGFGMVEPLTRHESKTVQYQSVASISTNAE